MPQHRQDPNLDLLRATAVLMVLGFHLLLSLRVMTGRLSWLFRFGRWAVLMFFVHTSLVLMFSLQRQAGAALGWRDYLAFMVRRCFRLLPLSTLVIAVVVVLDLPVAHVHHGQFSAEHPSVAGVLANVFLVQNLTGTESVMGTLWSLPFEMQMYLALPFAYVIAIQGKGRGYIVGAWAAAAVASTVATHLLRHHLDFLSFVPCFLPGVLAFALFRQPRTRRRWSGFAWTIAGLTALYVAFPVETVAWVACLALGCAIPLFQDMPAGRAWRVCHLVAKYSYGIYLTHFILIWVFFVRFADLPAAVRWVGFWLAAAIVPVALYHLVEEPLIRAGNRLATVTKYRQFRPRRSNLAISQEGTP